MVIELGMEPACPFRQSRKAVNVGDRGPHIQDRNEPAEFGPYWLMPESKSIAGIVPQL